MWRGARTEGINRGKIGSQDFSKFFEIPCVYRTSIFWVSLVLGFSVRMGFKVVLVGFV